MHGRGANRAYGFAGIRSGCENGLAGCQACQAASIPLRALVHSQRMDCCLSIRSVPGSWSNGPTPGHARRPS